MFQLMINSLLALSLAVHLTVMPGESNAIYSYERQEPRVILDSLALSVENKAIWEKELKREKVSEKIRRYSNYYGADPLLALNVACAESCAKNKGNIVVFNPNAKNPNSTASGIFQFIEGTWEAMCEGDVFNEDDNVRCGTKVLAKENGIKHWEASRKEGFGNGWENKPYEKFEVIN